MSSSTMLNYAKRLRSIAHLGLTYANNEYDNERYRELAQISLEKMRLSTGLAIDSY